MALGVGPAPPHTKCQVWVPLRVQSHDVFRAMTMAAVLKGAGQGSLEQEPSGTAIGRRSVKGMAAWQILRCKGRARGLAPHEELAE